MSILSNRNQIEYIVTSCIMSPLARHLRSSPRRRPPTDVKAARDSFSGRDVRGRH